MSYGTIPVKCKLCEIIYFVDDISDKCNCGGELDFYPYKGNGISSCKWCGGTGVMNTWDNDGRLLSGAKCWFCNKQKE